MLQLQTLPASLMLVLQTVRPCFTALSFRTFTVLTVGLVCLSTYA